MRLTAFLSASLVAALAAIVLAMSPAATIAEAGPTPQPDDAPVAPSEAPDSDAASSQSGEMKLKHRGWRSFELVLPQERYTKVSGALDFRAAGGAEFKATLEGDALRVDTDGDGKSDVTIEGESGFLRLKTPKGFRYAARLRNTPSGWAYATSGGLVGKIGSTRITLIDQDGNGSHADFGVDAMIVGRSKRATFLSKVINVEGELYAIAVAADGRSLRFQPYTGPAGVLNGTEKHSSEAKLLGAVVQSEDGHYSYDLASAKQGLRVPAGRYVLHSGALGLGSNLVQIKRGAAKAIEVPKDGQRSLSWGAPIRAEFGYMRNGGTIEFDPRLVRYFGAAGEEYVGWHPCGKSPEFTILDAKKQTELATAIFAGSG